MLRNQILIVNDPIGRMTLTKYTHEAWREVQPEGGFTIDRLREVLKLAHGYTACVPPPHGPAYRLFDTVGLCYIKNKK